MPRFLVQLQAVRERQLVWFRPTANNRGRTVCKPGSGALSLARQSIASAKAQDVGRLRAWSRCVNNYVKAPGVGKWFWTAHGQGWDTDSTR